MPLTPFHIAFAWLIKLKFRRLDFAALTAGSIVPDLEIPVFFAFGLGRDSLFAHSIVGALTVDIILSVLIVWILSKLRVNKIGLYGFGKARLTKNFAVSAAIGSLTHVFSDLSNHYVNPVFWPYTAIPSSLVDSVGIVYASLFIHSLALLILAWIIKRELGKEGESMGYLLKHPLRAFAITTKSLST